MKEQLEKVGDFHKAFEIDKVYSKEDEGFSAHALLRYTLMREENEEYLEAIKSGSEVEIADALGDMLYILCGTILNHGLQNVIEKVFEEIHRSNMSKLDADGRPIYREDGKVLKGPNYFPPNLKPLLEMEK